MIDHFARDIKDKNTIYSITFLLYVFNTS